MLSLGRHFQRRRRSPVSRVSLARLSLELTGRTSRTNRTIGGRTDINARR